VQNAARMCRTRQPRCLKNGNGASAGPIGSDTMARIATKGRGEAQFCERMQSRGHQVAGISPGSHLSAIFATQFRYCRLPQFPGRD
jgi:hypothetical protein